MDYEKKDILFAKIDVTLKPYKKSILQYFQ